LSDHVRADYWTKFAYVQYERALKPLARAGTSCESFLKEATGYLVEALNLKANWNPAQIYLALVYRVWSGVAEAMGNTVDQERYAAKADKLFSALRGVPLPEPKLQPTTWEVSGSVSGETRGPEGPPNRWQLNVSGSLQPKKEPQP